MTRGEPCACPNRNRIECVERRYPGIGTRAAFNEPCMCACHDEWELGLFDADYWCPVCGDPWHEHTWERMSECEKSA